MPLFLIKKISEHSTIGIWENIPDEDTFLEKIVLKKQEKNNVIKTDWRKSEILCARALIKELCGAEAEIIYDRYGKPQLKNSEAHISLSHSYKYVAAIVDKKYSTGIDIQKITPKITGIGKKFLSKTEMKNVSEENIEKLHVYWGAKESVYKSYGKRGLIFKENILVEPFDFANKGEIVSHLKAEEKEQIFNLNYEIFSEYMLVYVKEIINIVK